MALTNGMKTREGRIERRKVIEAHAAYDCSKTHRPLPDFTTWDWTQADAIDRELREAGLKWGVLGGYLLWDLVELTIPDLWQCAVLADIFPGEARALGFVGRARLSEWRPVPDTEWYERVRRAHVLSDVEPLVLRPALSHEAPASWYVEDGSGRAITLVAGAIAVNPFEPVAVAYLGREPDHASSFMRKPPFNELLNNRSRGH